MINLVGNPITREQIDNLVEWLKTYPRLTKGGQTLLFEGRFSKWLDCQYSCFVNSGSSANLLMLYALLVTKRIRNRKIVIPALSWSTDLAPAIQLGYMPILCDCNLEDLSVDLNYLEDIFKNHVPATLLLVSILGLPPNIDEIMQLCYKYDVILLEDCCEGVGSQVNGSKLGTFGLMSTFSFFIAHVFSTIEGGMICTDDKGLNNILLSLRSHGWGRDWSQEEQRAWQEEFEISDFNSLFTFYYPGFNVRSTDLQAYIGLQQMQVIDVNIKKRHDNYNKYRNGLKDELWKPSHYDNAIISNHAYPVLHPNRGEVVNELQKNKIEVRPLVCGSMKNQPFYQMKGYNVNMDLPNCDRVDQEGFFVPNHPDLSEKDIIFISDVINGV